MKFTAIIKQPNVTEKYTCYKVGFHYLFTISLFALKFCYFKLIYFSIISALFWPCCVKPVTHHRTPQTAVGVAAVTNELMSLIQLTSWRHSCLWCTDPKGVSSHAYNIMEACFTLILLEEQTPFKLKRIQNLSGQYYYPN